METKIGFNDVVSLLAIYKKESSDFISDIRRVLCFDGSQFCRDYSHEELSKWHFVENIFVNKFLFYHIPLRKSDKDIISPSDESRLVLFEPYMPGDFSFQISLLDDFSVEIWNNKSFYRKGSKVEKLFLDYELNKYLHNLGESTVIISNNELSIFCNALLNFNFAYQNLISQIDEGFEKLKEIIEHEKKELF